MTGDKLDNIIDEAIHYYEALHQESDRAAAILAASHFEDSLQEQIISKFTNMNSELTKKIFGGYGPLSTFSGKIDIAFALGLYNEETRKGLHIIKKIRNKFAHASKPIKFYDQEIAVLCRKISSEVSTGGSDNLRKTYIDYLQESENSFIGW